MAGENVFEKIIDAWREGNEFIVKSPTFETLRVSIRRIPKLNTATPEEVDRFEIDDYGDFVYWPDFDIHIGWAQLEQIVDPSRRLKAEQKRAAFNRRYGQAIRRFREQAGIPQSAIEGLDERTVRRIEHGQTPASSNAIRKLARAHRMERNLYMRAIAERMRGKVD